MSKEKELSEGNKIIDSLKKAIGIMIALVIFSMILGGEFFGGMISVIGFALVFLLVYAIR